MPARKTTPKKSLERCLSFDVGARNLSYCSLVRKDKKFLIDSWDTVDIITKCGSKAKKAYSVHCNTLVKYLITCLHEIFNPVLEDPSVDWNKTAIVIEEQPGRSLRMKVLSYAIVSYFETISVARNLNIRIETMSAKNKLILCDKIGVPKEKPVKRKTTLNTNITAKQKTQRKRNAIYRVNKWRGIEGCRMVLEQFYGDEENENKTKFKKSKKKDDFADSLLQGLFYMGYEFSKK